MTILVRTKRSFAAFTAAAIGLVGLAACSGEPETASTNGTSSEESVTLEFWDMAWGPAETYPVATGKLIEQFESENPNIKVNYTLKSWDGWYQTFTQAVGANAAPDVSTGGGFQPFGLQSEADAILPLNPLIDQWKTDGTADDFTDGMLDYYKDADGDILAVPWATDIRVWYYREDVLKNAGVDVPTTYDEFAQACDVVHQSDPQIYGISDGGTPHWTFLQGIANGAGIFDKEGNAALTSPKQLEALKYIASMGQGGSGCINPSATTVGQEEAIEMFNQGKSAFVMDSPSMGRRLSADTLKHAKVLPPLANANGQKLGLYFVNGIMGYNQTEHPDEAMQFIGWWSEHGKELFVGGASGVSPRQSIDTDPMFDDSPLYREATELWGAPVGQPLFALASQGSAALNTVDGDSTMLDLERALFSGKDVDAAAKAAQAKVQMFVDEES